MRKGEDIAVAAGASSQNHFALSGGKKQTSGEIQPHPTSEIKMDPTIAELEGSTGQATVATEYPGQRMASARTVLRIRPYPEQYPLNEP